MCGIVGFMRRRGALSATIKGLRVLEYRGYDSAGVAFVENGKFQIYRQTGRLDRLAAEIANVQSDPSICFGHTRWATHGGATVANAHPHSGKYAVLVHNGIIENFADLKEMLQDQGFTFRSETDTETIALLLDYEISQIVGNSSGSISDADLSKIHLQALSRTLRKLKGAYSLIIQFVNEPDVIYASARHSPLILGATQAIKQDTEINDVEYGFASDRLALVGEIKFAAQLEDQTILRVERNSSSGKSSFSLYDLFLKPAQLSELEELQLDNTATDRGSFPHYMLKEIHEQPVALYETLQSVREQLSSDPKVKSFISAIQKGTRINFVACGTSLHACILARHFLESRGKVSGTAELASEMSTRGFVDQNAVYVFASQSGETRDTLAALDLVKAAQRPSLSVVNVAGSQLSVRCDATLLTRAGPEIGVASTKAFTCQLCVLLLLCAEAAAGNAPSLKEQVYEELEEISKGLEGYLKACAGPVRSVASSISSRNSALFVGRGLAHALASEGALKLKEISYIHAEGYAAGELKHGPLALVDSSMPVVIVVSREFLDKTMSTVQEIAARGGPCVILIAQDLVGRFLSKYDSQRGSRRESCLTSPKTQPSTLDGEAPTTSFAPVQFITVPASGQIGEVISHSVALQLLAYYAGCARGYDVDRPRNLAKCVTVE